MDDQDYAKDGVKLERTGCFEIRSKLVRPGHVHDWKTKRLFKEEIDHPVYIVACTECGVQAFDDELS